MTEAEDKSDSGRPYHAIGDVLSLLKTDFPDITISKIRFLESQGLLAPERTPSGFRKFYDNDIARLKWILEQQRDNFLPLRVIKERLLEIKDIPKAPGKKKAKKSKPQSLLEDPLPLKPSGDPDIYTQAEVELISKFHIDEATEDEVEMLLNKALDAPYGFPTVEKSEDVANTPESAAINAAPFTSSPNLAAQVKPQWIIDYAMAKQNSAPQTSQDHTVEENKGDLQAFIQASTNLKKEITKDLGFNPANAKDKLNINGSIASSNKIGGNGMEEMRSEPQNKDKRSQSKILKGRVPHQGPLPTSSAELAAIVGCSASEMDEIIEFGLVTPEEVAGVAVFTDEAIELGSLIHSFRELGLEPRHLSILLHGAKREADLYSQMLAPVLKQRNPEAKEQVKATGKELSNLGARTHQLLVRRALRAQIGR